MSYTSSPQDWRFGFGGGRAPPRAPKGDHARFICHASPLWEIWGFLLGKHSSGGLLREIRPSPFFSGQKQRQTNHTAGYFWVLLVLALSVSGGDGAAPRVRAEGPGRLRAAAGARGQRSSEQKTRRVAGGVPVGLGVSREDGWAFPPEKDRGARKIGRSTKVKQGRRVLFFLRKTKEGNKKKAGTEGSKKRGTAALEFLFLLLVSNSWEECL